MTCPKCGGKTRINHGPMPDLPPVAECLRCGWGAPCEELDKAIPSMSDAMRDAWDSKTEDKPRRCHGPTMHNFPSLSEACRWCGLDPLEALEVANED